MILKQILDKTTQHFKNKGMESPRLDAELLIGHVLGLSRVEVYTKFDSPLTSDEIDACRDVVKRRSQGEPVAYITGSKSFYGHDFFVERGVLVPRPETEHLVDIAVQKLNDLKLEKARVLDLGCGSGCIGLTVAEKFPSSQVTLIDISPVAIDLANKNARSLNLDDRVEIIQIDANTFSSDFKFDMVLANPPYIDKEDTNIQASVKKFEPSEALFADDQGLSCIYDWTRLALTVLPSGGYWMFEIGATQGNASCSYLKSTNQFENIELIKDYAGFDRVVVSQRK